MKLSFKRCLAFFLLLTMLFGCFAGCNTPENSTTAKGSEAASDSDTDSSDENSTTAKGSETASDSDTDSSDENTSCTIESSVPQTGTSAAETEPDKEETKHSDSQTEGSTEQPTSETEDNTAQSSAEFESESLHEGDCQVFFRNPDGSYIETVTVKSGEKVTKPDDPTSPHGEFVLWQVFDEATLSYIPYDFDTPITTPFFDIYALWNEHPAIEITSLKVDTENKQITVSYYANQRTSLIVKFVDEENYFSSESGEYLYLDNAEKAFQVTSTSYTSEKLYVEKTVSFDFELPEKFVPIVFEIDYNTNTYKLLYTTIEYTEKYESFISVSPDDFEDADTVISFGGENDPSFGVLADDVRVLTAGFIEEIVDENGNVTEYVISSPSASIAVGDKVFITTSDGENYALFMAETVNEIGTVISVTPMSVNADNAYDLTSFYKFLRIDTSDTITFSNEDNDTVSPLSSRSDNDVPFYDFNMEKVFYNKGICKLVGTIKGSITPKITAYYAPKLFGEKYFYCQVTFETEVYTALKFTVKSEGEGTHNIKEVADNLELPLGKLRVPIGYGFNTFVDFDFYGSFKLNGSLIISNTVKNTIGFSYSSKEGVKGISENSFKAGIEDCQGSAVVRFGIIPSAGIGFLGNLVEAKVSCFLGAEVRADLCGKLVTETRVKNDDTHLCSLCVDIEVFAVAELNLALETNLGLELDIKIDYEDPDLEIHYEENFKLDLELGYPIVKKKWKLAEFYVSIISKEDFDKIGEGNCPNHAKVQFDIYPYVGGEYKHPTSLAIYDANGNNIDTYVNLDAYIVALGENAGAVLDVINNYLSSNPKLTLNDLKYTIKNTNEAGKTIYTVKTVLQPGTYTVAVFYAKKLLCAVGDEYIEKNEDFAMITIYVDEEYNVFAGGEQVESVEIYPQNWPYREKTYTINVTYNHHVSYYIPAYGNSRVTTEKRPRAGKEYKIIYNYFMFFASGEMRATVDSDGQLNLTFYLLDLPFDVQFNFDPQHYEYQYSYVVYEEITDNEGHIIYIDTYEEFNTYADSGYFSTAVFDGNYIYESDLDAGIVGEILSSEYVFVKD